MVFVLAALLLPLAKLVMAQGGHSLRWWTVDGGGGTLSGGGYTLGGGFWRGGALAPAQKLIHLPIVLR